VSSIESAASDSLLDPTMDGRSARFKLAGKILNAATGTG
jgi:hypothetical protein